MSLVLIAVTVMIVTFLIYVLMYGATNLRWDG
jgi:hypothetical protein